MAMAYIGIDISKATFDACLLRHQGKPLHKAFSNSDNGFRKLLRWVESQAADTQLRFCMEATGVLGNALAMFLAEAGLCVSVENPARIKHFGISLGNGNKTDKADALTIALYCRDRQPAAWRLAAPEMRELVALLRRYESLQSLLQQEQCRLAEPALIPTVKQSLEQTISFLQEEMRKLHEAIEQHVDSLPQLRRDKALLETIPGIGRLTALRILAELPDVSQFDRAQAAAAYGGLNPREYRSGSSVHHRTRMSKSGNKRLRKALYLPAVCAVRCNPLVREIYQRLLAAGKPKMVALGAAMRKLLMIAYGVLKSQRPFTPHNLHQAA